MMRASDGAGLVLWPAVKGIMIEAGASRRTVQYNLRRLVQMQVLAVEVHENQWVNKDYFRRTRTYKLNIVRLKAFPRPKEVNSSEWRTYKEYKSVTRKKAAYQVHRSPHAAPHTTVHQAPHAPAPVVRVPSPAPAQIVKPPGITRPQQRLHEKRIELMALVGQYIKGVTQILPPEGGMGRDVGPGDDGYVPPLLPQKALSKAAKELGMTFEEAEHELKLVGWKPENESE